MMMMMIRNGGCIRRSMSRWMCVAMVRGNIRCGCGCGW